jgi:AraC-like DNA-binding protein
MLLHYAKLFASQNDFHISVGKMSRDKLRHLKYMAVSAIALLCRAAMEGGMQEAAAYGKSDKAIMEIDRLDDPSKILLLLAGEVYAYAQAVERSRVALTWSKAVRDSIEYIMANLSSGVKLDDLMQFTSLSKEHFSRIFKKEVGKTFRQYTLELRIEAAKRMLQGSHSAEETAYMLQFCSQSYFIKQFKKVTGMTPYEYRRRIGVSKY